MDPRSEEVDYEAYLNSFYAEGGQSPQVPEQAVDTTDNVVPSLSPVPKLPKVEKQESASLVVEWTFNDPDSEYNVLRDEDGSLKASTVPKVIAKLTLDAGMVHLNLSNVLSLTLQTQLLPNSFCSLTGVTMSMARYLMDLSCWLPSKLVMLPVTPWGR